MYKAYSDITINQKKFKDGKYSCGIVQPISALSNYTGLKPDDKFTQHCINKAIKKKILDKKTGSRIDETLPFVLEEYNRIYKFTPKIGYKFSGDMTFDNFCKIMKNSKDKKGSPIMVGLRLSKSFLNDLKDDGVIQSEHPKSGIGHFAYIVKLEDDMWRGKRLKVELGMGYNHHIFTIPYNKIRDKEIMSWCGYFTGLVSHNI